MERTVVGRCPGLLKVVNDLIVKLDESQVGLGDQQVFVVPMVTNDCGTMGVAWQVIVLDWDGYMILIGRRRSLADQQFGRISEGATGLTRE